MYYDLNGPQRSTEVLCSSNRLLKIYLDRFILNEKILIVNKTIQLILRLFAGEAELAGKDCSSSVGTIRPIRRSVFVIRRILFCPSSDADSAKEKITS
jgi:hypothetical protein